MTDAIESPAFALPETLSSQGYALRREGDPDLPFLIQLYASTRASEMAIVPWTRDEKDAFILQQFGAQRRHYYHFSPNAAFDVLEQHGRPVGRLYIDRRQTCYNVMDIALMPAECGKGIGTTILTALKAHAEAQGMGVILFVEPENPARRLYQRLGFVETRGDEMNIEMEWMPEDVS